MGIIAGFLRKWVLGRLLKRNPLVFVLLWVVNRLRRSHRTAREIPLSSLRARGRVGADFLDRNGFADAAASPEGQLEDLDALAADADGARDDAFDPDAVDRGVRRFYEHTAVHTFVYRVRWGRGFRLGARIASRITRRIEQLALPGTRTDWRRLHSRFVPVDLPEDPRDDVRGWVRTDEDGTCVFLALYGTHAADDGDGAPGERYVNIAVPLPGCTLSTVLRARNLDGGGMLRRERPDGGIELTTAGGGDTGLYLRLPALAVRLPVSQRFRVWSTSSNEGGELRASHEMWLFGLQFLTVEYRIG